MKLVAGAYPLGVPVTLAPLRLAVSAARQTLLRL
jgi:hypothetical protein